MRRAVFVVMVALLLCMQFASAEADSVSGSSLITDVQAKIDSVWPDGEEPVLESVLTDEWVTAYAYQGLRSQRYPIWTPDGTYVYFTTQSVRISALWRVEVATGQLELVTTHRWFYDDHELPGSMMQGLGFINDGSEILVYCFVIDEDAGTVVTPAQDHEDGSYTGYSVTNPRRVVMAVDVETGEQRPYLWDVSFVECSMSGNYVVYHGNGTGTVVRNTNTDEEWIYDSVICNTKFLEDEETIVYMINGVMYSIPFGGGEAVQLSADCPFSSVSDISPDGAWVVGETSVGARSGNRYDEDGEPCGQWSTTNMYKLQLWDSNTKKSFDLLSMDDNVESRNAIFSPDGNSIAYKRIDKESADISSEIYVMDFDAATYKDIQVDVAEESPASFALLGNYPNPFNPTTTIGFALEESGPVSLTVFSVTGQAVRELVNGQMVPGRHGVVWDGCDDAGNKVAAGVYISRLVTGGKSETGRMMLVK